MSALSDLPQWQALQQHYQLIKDTHLRELFSADPHRFEHFSLEAAGLLLDYSKNRIDQQTLSLFNDLLNALDLKTKINTLFSGQPVNSTEQRPALHTALRSDPKEPIYVAQENIMPAIAANLDRMQNLVERIHQQRWLEHNQAITDIINIGIGGSDLGPALVTEALRSYHHTPLNIHFISNIDSAHIEGIFKKLNPASTLFIISSKSFSTQETLLNAKTARRWFQQQNTLDFKNHFIAVTGDAAKAQAFGIAQENIFPVWQWVGGRYSLWSAIGLPIALAVGMTNFRELLLGARAMDQHFKSADYLNNMPVILALLSNWYINFFGAGTQAILPYAPQLAKLPAYLQQAEMESTGKQIRHDGTPADYRTGPIIFGTSGTNGQHAFYQLLHQGTQLIPSDFIVTALNDPSNDPHHALLFTHALSQSKALFEGRNLAEAYAASLAAGMDADTARRLSHHKVLPGNQPSNTIVLPQLTPQALGALIALYEHKIFVESVIWDINAFDQWGVETGKQLVDKILPHLQACKSNTMLDASTAGLVQYFHRLNHPAEKT